jgi:thymidylate synthase
MFCFEDETAEGLWMQVRDLFLAPDTAVELQSRTGRVREIRPVFLALANPRNRWVLSRAPAINPAAVLSEVVWILGGRDDSDFVNFWNPQLPKHAGAGERYYGAYGYRLHHRFDVDQLSAAANALTANPESRQVCLVIFDPHLDIPGPSGRQRAEDIPCNVLSMLKVREDKLHWVQIMRSNDFWLGLPFNIVQFTTLQEIMAGWIGVGLGSYHHLSDSVHLYPEWEEPLVSLSATGALPTNSDDFTAVDRTSSVRLLGEITSRLDSLVYGSEEEVKWGNLMPSDVWPDSYANLLRVILADAARRRGEHAFVQEVISQCSNPVLTLAWERWQDRVSA